MKKVINFWSLAVIIALCVGFASCDKDDNKGKGDDTTINESDIVGKWQMFEVVPDDDDYDDCDFEGWIDIRADKTFTEYDACEDDTSIGTWKIDGSTMTVIHNAFPIPIAFRVVSVSANELVLEIDFGTLGKEIQKYKRI